MQDQNPAAMLQVTAVEAHQQYAPGLQQAAAAGLSSAVLQSLTGTGHPPWSTADTGALPPLVDYGGTPAATSALVLDDVLTTTSTAAFQQLLDSFGDCQSDVDDDVDDDTVVSLDPESLSLQARHATSQTFRSFRHRQQQQQQQQPRLHSIIQPQQHAVCSAARC